MPTLLLQLVGPMQAWGTSSRFDERDTGKEPSKSGVIGLLASALGIDRANWDDLKPLCDMRMGVRHDRPGLPRYDYQTAGQGTENIRFLDGEVQKRSRIVLATGKHPSGQHLGEGAQSWRHYLADAAFLVGLDGSDRALLERAHAALANPVWPLALGRKSYVPSEPIWMPNAVVDADLRDALLRWPRIAPHENEQSDRSWVLSIESTRGEGLMKMDQPLSSFAERRFGPRYVLSEVCDVPDPIAA
jgi:CRISPR system Cascade subunit CasD